METVGNDLNEQKSRVDARAPTGTFAHCSQLFSIILIMSYGIIKIIETN